MTDPRKIAVIGAGISGLATAYYLENEAVLKGLDLDIRLLEKADRVGGVIRTEKREGLVLEWGPENFVPFKPEVARLARELGMGDDLLGSNDDRRQTYVIHDGRIEPLPDGMAFLAPVKVRPFFASSLLTPSGKIRAMLEPLIPRSRGDLSVRHFLNRRLGVQLTDRVAEPLVSAIYGGDIDQLSIASALPDTYRVEQKYGSLWSGMRKASRNGQAAGSGKLPFFMTLRGGMTTLVEAIQRSFKKTTTETTCGEVSLNRQDGGYVVRTGRSEGLYDAVVVCTPASSTARILSHVASEASAALGSILYTSTSLVYMAFRRREFSHPLNGFGFVTPEGESAVLDACTWVSTKFDDRCPPDSVLLRCAIHDGRRERQFGSEAETIDAVLGELRRLMGINAVPYYAKVFHVGKSMPQMVVGHARKLKAIQESIGRNPGLYVIGPFSGGVGVPDCIRTARQAVSAALGQVFS